MINTLAIADATRSTKRRRNKALAGLPKLGDDPASAGSVSGSGELVAFACECRKANCRLEVRLEEGLFESLLEVKSLSLVAPGHAGADEHVVAGSAGYQFVVPAGHVFEFEPVDG